MGLSTSNYLIKKTTPHKCAQLVNYRCGQVDSSHHGYCAIKFTTFPFFFPTWRSLSVVCMCSACRMCVQISVCPCGSQGRIVCVLLCYYLIPSTQKLSVNLELGWQSADPSDPSISCTQSWGLFMCVLGIRAQVFVLAQQMLLPTEPSP